MKTMETKVNTLVDMSKEESVRKLLQLRPVLNQESHERFLDPEHTLSSDLAWLVREGKVKNSDLVPFLVSAIQGLAIRIESLEREMSRMHNDVTLDK